MQLELRITVEEGRKIWQYFSRFAEYQDLKDLYKKVIPEIAKFEQKMINYETEVAKMNMIMRRFDETLSLKANKTVIDKLQEYMDNTFTTKEDHNAQVTKTDEIQSDMLKKLDHLNELIEFLKESLYNKITKDVKNATAHLRNSVLQEDAEGLRKE